MKKMKFGLGLVALSMSASAWAMPEAVPARWWENMQSRLAKMADNPGFCKVFYYVDVCQ